MAPYITIIIFSVLGLIFWGFKGLIIGLIIGKVATYGIALLAWPVSKIFDIGPVKKKYRKAIAKNFLIENEESIRSIPKFSAMSDSELIIKFSTSINEIFDSAIKIKNPIKMHNYDMEYPTNRNNFLRGGIEIWSKKFSDPKESVLMTHFVMFCVNELYEKFYKYEHL